MTVAAACCGLLPFGCVKEDGAALGDRHDVTVQLNVGTRAVGESDGTPTSAEAAIHTLRVYAFANGRPAGYYFAENLPSGEHTFLMDITFYSVGEQTVDFYVVANEAAMSGLSLAQGFSEGTPSTQLDNCYFAGLKLENDLAAGLPMFCKRQEVLDFTKESSQTPTDTSHAGHTLLDYNIKFDLERPMGKLGVFAAKPEGEQGTLYVTGLTMLESGMLARNYLMPHSEDELKQIGLFGDRFALAVVENEVTAEISENAAAEVRSDASKYTPVLNTPFYPFENPWGSDRWDVEGDEKGNILKIDYKFNDVAREGLVYLPPIERNHYYTICCLMHNSGKITIEYRVAEWDEVTYELEFDYPTYSTITPLDASLPEGGQYAQPKVWCNPSDSAAGSCSFAFSLTAPTGQKWVPTFLNATEGDFSATVYRNGAVVDPTDYVASQDIYTIVVHALNPDNIGKEVQFAISYTPSWDPEGSSLLQINGHGGDTKWEGSPNPEAIVIKQTEMP